MKIATWNIQFGRGVDGRVDLARIAGHLRRFADADLVCLQEVADGYPEMTGDDSDQFAALARLWPGHVAIDGIATETHDGARRRRFGNLLLSRLPLRQVFRHLLPWPADPDCKSMQRIAVEATVESPFGALRVTTTHLEYYSAVQRMAQVERLRELQREAVSQARAMRPGQDRHGPFRHVPRAAGAVLTGDLNCGPGSPELARLLAPIDAATPRYVDAWALAHPGRPCDPTVGVHDRRQWPEPMVFDHLLVSEDLATRVRDLRVDATSDASDHQAMVLELG